ncbi:tape measure protein [Xylocopilactobacillus apis]|uniref:Tape measure protein N-terminal domain-containing protein n=1 Tax=Xylocopilactobacillus apis TaxID=2932183 RepID=A0AAU9D636_9LACO|nr:tape measure protein [Xylocopilactobacillus apis]BDR56875.1 hypothetical protein KIMC2_14370 [Xylocopilactobacillus apis]
MVNTIDTEIHLNGSQPVQTLKSLKSEVSSLTSAWKAEEIQLKSSGDSLQAAKAKYDGLSQAVNKQKDYIAKLKQEQGQIDQSTNRGAESYAKFGTQIENANRKLASMESQQTRAKDSWKYYESGVAESKKKLDEISASSEAYVKRLQAEGREQEANKAKLSALKSSYSEMQNLYSKQAGELDRIARESGKASDAYKKQEIRVNELGAKLATTKNDMTELSAATSKVKSSPFLRLKEALGGASKEAKEGATSFKSFLGATVIGNAVSNSISTFTSKAKEAFNVGMELNKTIGKIKATWVNMGKSDSDINNLINQMESLRIKTGYSADEVGTLQRSVDALTHGDTNKTLKITEGLSQVGLASKLSGEQVDALGKSFLRLASRDKINATAMAKIESIAPTISKALAGAAGVSEATFAKMVNDGQITGEKLQDLMVKASSQGENVFTTFAKSAGGAQVQIKRLWEDLSQRFSAPIFSVRATGLSDVAQILSSPVLKTAASTMGEGLKKIADYGISFLNYLNTHKAVLSGIVGDIWDITKTLASDVWKIFSDVFKNIVSSFNALSGNAVKSKDPLTQVKTLLDSISKNKEGIELVAKAVASLIAIKGITGFASKIANVAGSLKQISKTTIGSDGGTLGKLVGSGSSVKTAVSEGATATSKVGAVAGGLGVAVGAGFDLLGAIKAKNSDEKFKKYGSTLGDLIGGGIGLAFGGPAGAAIGGTIGHLLGDLGGKGAKGFMDGWTKVGKGQKPEGILQTIGFDAKKLLTQVTKTISSLTKPVTEAFKKVFSPVAKALKPVLTPMLKEFSSFSKSVDKALKPVSKVFSTVFKDVGKAIGPALKDVKSFIKDGLDVLGKAFQVTTKLISTVWNTAWGLMGKRLKEEWAIIGPTVKAGISVISKVLTATLRVISTVWLSTWNNLKTVVSGAWNIIKTTVKSALNVIKDIFKVVLDVLRGNWRAVWNDVKKIFSDVFNGIVSIAKSILGSLANVIKSAIDGIKSVWKSVWGSISDIFSSVMKGLRGIAVGAFNGVLGVINAAIGAINGVWHFFSGHNALNKLSYIKKAKGGTVGKEHLTMVNDGLGNDWKELIQRPNGELFMSQKKNEIMPLEEGTRVYNGFETKQIMQTFGIEHYAGGGIIGGLVRPLVEQLTGQKVQPKMLVSGSATSGMQ